MAPIFRSEGAAHDRAADALFSGRRRLRGGAAAFLLLLVALLLFGTLKLEFLKSTCGQTTLPVGGVAPFKTGTTGWSRSTRAGANKWSACRGSC